ncbi:glycosyltransferase family 4 protein [Paenibacillus sp. FSL R5-0912]|uniref:glycosyltransferase family 4 protein n=1 Tax=Paenibacillus sp. FSL R5-0912 TaxID=1536771 RepID=UPI000695003B|nr:glycosyltransferase family 4 protein [Paenibacillus sp. FSL R5-0912]
MKKICLFAAHFYPHLGGIETYTLQLAKKMILSNYEVIVVTSNIDDSPEYELYQGIKVYRFPVLKFINGRLPFPKFNMSFLKILKKIKAENSDYYILNARFYIHSIIGSLIAKREKKPVILIEHGTGHFTLNNKLLDLFGHIYEHTITFFLKRLVKEFYGVSYACNKWLQHFGITAIDVLYNGIDVNYQIKSHKNYRDFLHIDNDEVVITYAGRLIKEKGIISLVDTFNKLCAKHNNISLVIAGDGPLHSEVIKMKTEKISLLGRMEHDEVLKLMTTSDIFVLTTNFPEGLPTSILEAALYQCAILASPRGGTPEVVIDDSYGILINPLDNDAIYRGLDILISDKKNRVMLSKNVREKVLAEFDWSVTATNLINNLQRIDKLDKYV